MDRGYPDWEHWFLPLSFHSNSGVEKCEQVSFQSAYDCCVYDYWVFSFSFLVGIVDVESLCVSYVDLEGADFSWPVEIVDDVVLHVQDPVVVAFWDEVQEERLLLHSRHFDEELVVVLEEGSSSIVDGNILSVNLTNLFVDSVMYLPPHIDCVAQVLEVDVEIGHQEFSKPERQKQLTTLLHPVAVGDFECAEGEGSVAKGPILHHGELLEASRVPEYEGAIVHVKLV